MAFGDTIKRLNDPSVGAFRRYVVIEVLSSTDFDTDGLKEISKNLDNPDALFMSKNPEGDPEKEAPFMIAPRNSIIAKRTSGGEGPTTEKKLVMYPFFSSHLSLPVKPGEYVWGFEEPGGNLFWVSRIHEPDHVEDTNFTHGDRRENPVIQGTFQDPKKKFPTTPGFQNGDDVRNVESEKIDPKTTTQEDLDKKGIQYDQFTLPKINSYEKIYEENKAKDQIVYEPVPRFSKRPGDLSFQGSNNTSICLGTERGYTSDSTINENMNSVDPKSDGASKGGLSEGMGAIDIVAGRGRIHPGSAAEVDKKPSGTRPRVVKNTRDEFETNKNPGLDKIKAPKGSALADLAEGDPDFLRDASRIYMSMKTNPDALFSLSYPLLAIAPIEEISPTPDNAAVVLKSDQIRIIARKDEENNINGAVRIVKEGTGDTDRAVIVMEPDGTIMIDGPRIVIGTGTESPAHGGGQQVFIGRDASESVVLGDTLGELLCKFIGSIVQNQATISMGAGSNILNPAVVTAATQVLTALGGTPAGTHTAATNTTLSKNAKTK